MRITQKTMNLINGKDTYLTFNEAEECPICHAKIVGKYLASAIWQNNNQDCATTLNFCTGCCNVFINCYNIKFERKDTLSLAYYHTVNLISSDPKHFETRVFDNNIKTLSPSFDTIYNQAKQAETMNLDQIAGIGYRKSLEFLAKDFAIKYNPDDEDKIKNMPLSNCIKTYIDDPRIKNLAEKSIWLGNDETHYVRKHEDRDISDMKQFIDALVYFISMILITEDAESIQKV